MAKGRYDFIILGLYQTIKDERGNYVPPEKVAKWTSENSTIPVFGFWDFSVGNEAAIGGLVLQGKDQGLEAGKIVFDLLNGKEIKTVKPISDNSGVFIFSRSQLTRWKIRLPEEIFRQVRFVD